jgi:protein-L-isoaspartate(D-aspartate) O-methyltransferase
MFLVVGDAPAMRAMLVSRNDAGDIWREDLFETVLPPLQQAPDRDRFVF